jgi:hypothetical protein
MELTEQLIIFRGLERLIIILFSGMSLVLGWHLFKIGVLSEQQSEIKAGDIWIKLQKVGPGVFFALFGVVVFIYSLSSPFNFELSSVDTKQPPDDADTPIVVKGSYLSQDQKKYLKLSKSINTINEIYETTATPNFSNSDKQLLLVSIENLEKERDVWIAAFFGKNSLSLWASKGNDCVFPASLP